MERTHRFSSKAPAQNLPCGTILVATRPKRPEHTNLAAPVSRATKKRRPAHHAGCISCNGHQRRKARDCPLSQEPSPVVAHAEAGDGRDFACGPSLGADIEPNTLNNLRRNNGLCRSQTVLRVWLCREAQVGYLQLSPATRETPAHGVPAALCSRRANPARTNTSGTSLTLALLCIGPHCKRPRRSLPRIPCDWSEPRLTCAGGQQARETGDPRFRCSKQNADHLHAPVGSWFGKCAPETAHGMAQTKFMSWSCPRPRSSPSGG